jgi:aspartyl protease family protein
MSDGEGPWRREAPQPPRRGRGRIGLWLLLAAALGGLVAALARAFPEAVRTPDDWAQVAYAVGVVLLVSTGIFRLGPRRFADRLKHAAIWLAVIAVLALGFAYRDAFSGAGQRLRLAFSAGDPVATGEHELVIPQDDRGSFVVVGKVNGQRVRFVVDTGATDTVLSPDDARRIGVDVANLDYGEPAETANGVGYSASFTARRLEVGPIGFDEFKLAINQAPMSSSLLGLSFLRRLQSFEHRDGQLILRWRAEQN